MKNKILYLAVAASLLAAACKDGNNVTNNPPPEESENRPPEAFSLITVKDSAKNVDLKPEFSWEPAADPDGDKVTYTIYLDISNRNPTTEYASGLSATSYTSVERLPLQRQFYWKVVADDGRGGEVSSTVFSFETKHGSLQLTTFSAGTTPAIGYAAAVAFKDKLWLIGGSSHDEEGVYFTNSQWFTSDGKSWRSTDDDSFSPRSGHAVLVFKDKMWIIGGRNNSGALGDVWYSSNGSAWSLATKNLTPRFGHESLVYDGKMWIIGGYTQEDGYMNDVWYSSDGANWSRATEHAVFPPRALHSALVFKDKMWVFGGWDGDFVEPGTWTSSDGITWTPANDYIVSVKIAYHTSVVYGGKIWIIPGKSNVSLHKIIDWHWETGFYGGHSPSDFSERYAHASAVFDGKLWIIGGSDGDTYYNDVWYIE